MTSRERMLAAMSGEPVDYTPCSFMAFFNLRGRARDEVSFVEQQLAMGLDAYTHVGYLGWSMHADARERVWSEREGDGTVFCRHIDTPKGPLTQRVVQAEGWPTADNFDVFNDWVVPRATEVLVKPEQDLEKLPYLLGPFRDAEIRALRETAAVSRELARRHGVLQMGGWSSCNSSVRSDDGVMGVDAMAWLSGFVDVMVLSLTRPDLMREYARIIHEWNARQIAVYLDETECDIVVRRAWYETTEFWTPSAYRAIVFPFLKREVDLVHQAGRKFGLITTSAFVPILDDILAAGVDVLIGLDPEEGKGTDLAEVKRRFRAKRRAIWGGVSGAVTVEQGTEADTDRAVGQAMRIIGEGGGFILSPVDNVRDDTPNAWRNTRRLIETWKRLR